jgi:hypothetical protein
MFHTVLYGELGVLPDPWAIHRLEEKHLESKILVLLRFHTALGKYQLQFITRAQDKLGPHLWTDTNPVNFRMSRYRPIGLNCNFKPKIMKRTDKGIIELEQRLAARADHEGCGALVRAIRK